MVAQKLWASRTAFLLQFREELCEGVRIESRVIHDVSAKKISFRFCLPAVVQKHGLHTESTDHGGELTECAASQETAQNTQGELRHHLLAGLASAMSLDDVRNFVRHHAGQLGFVVCGLDRTHIHIDRSSRESEGIDIFLIYHVKAIGPFLARRMGGEFVAKTLDVFRHRIRIRENGQLTAYLSFGLPPGLGFLLGREHIETMRRLDASLKRLQWE